MYRFCKDIKCFIACSMFILHLLPGIAAPFIFATTAFLVIYTLNHCTFSGYSVTPLFLHVSHTAMCFKSAIAFRPAPCYSKLGIKFSPNCCHAQSVRLLRQAGPGDNDVCGFVAQVICVALSIWPVASAWLAVILAVLAYGIIARFCY